MECKTARQLVNLVYPNLDELDGAEDEALHSHLKQCAQCASLAEWEKQIAQRMQDVPIPPGLQLRILSKLRTSGRNWRRWALRVASAAAVLALLLLFIWTWWLRPLPWIDSQKVLQSAYARIPNSAAAVQAAFESEFGVDMEAPHDFHYFNLTKYGMKRFQGHLVPQLTFLHRGDEKYPEPAVAELYVLSPKQFDVEKTWQHRIVRDESHHRSMEILQGNREFLFVVVYTGRTLKPFKKEPSKLH